MDLMALFSQQHETADNEVLLPPVINFTQCLDTLPTLRVVASLGQWYPEELQSSSSSFEIADDTLLNDSPELCTEMPSHQKAERHISASSAGRTETNCRKKQSTCFVQSEQKHTSSCVNSKQRQVKSDASRAVHLSSKHSRVPWDRAVNFDKLANNESVRSNRRHRVEGGDRHSVRGSQGMELRSAKTKSEASARDDRSYKHQTSRDNGSDVCKSVAGSDVIKTCCPASGAERFFDSTTDDMLPLFQSGAVNKYRTVEGTKEHSGGEPMHFVVKMQSVLEWTDAFPVGSSECCENDDLLEAEMSALDQSHDGGRYGEALVESVGRGRTESLKSGFELPSADNNIFKNNTVNSAVTYKLCNENVNGNTIPVGIKYENSINNCESIAVENDYTECTHRSVLGINCNHLQREFDNNVKVRRHLIKTCIYHTSDCVNSSISDHTFTRWRRFSCGNLYMSASIDGLSSPRLSDVYAGGRGSTWPTAMQCGVGGRDGPAVKEAVVPTSEGDADCLQQPAATWSNDAPLTDPSQLLPYHSENGGRPTLSVPSTDELSCGAGALCYAAMQAVGGAECVSHEQSLPSNLVVGGRGAVDVERLATGVSWQPDLAVADESPALGVPLGIPADIPTAACFATAADNTASYFAELPLCLPAYCSDYSTDSVMGLVESLTDDADMQKNTVESLDISSTLAVSIRGGDAADVPDSRVTGRSDGVGWDSLLNPAQSGESAGDVLSACSVERSTAATADDGPCDQHDIGGQLPADTLGWPSCAASAHESYEPTLRDLSACEDEVQLAVGIGFTQTPADDIRHTVDDQSTRSSADQPNVQTVDVSTTDNYSRVQDELYGDGALADDDVSWRRSRAVDDESLRRGVLNVLSTALLYAVNANQQDSSRRSRGDASSPARAECPSDAAVPAGMTDERLADDVPTQQEPPGTVTAAVGRAPALTKPVQPAARAVEKLADNETVSDDDEVENFVETDHAGVAVESDVACGDAVSVARPRRCSDEVVSTSPRSCDINDHVSADSATMMLGNSAPDDDDVDRKLADELERLKNLIVSSPKACDDQTATSASHWPDLEDSCEKDLDYDSAGSSSDNNDQLLDRPFVANVPRETGASVLECGDSELPCTVDQELENVEHTRRETAASLHTEYNGSLDDDEVDEVVELTADDNDSVSVSLETPTDSLPPADSAVEHRQVMDKVSDTEHCDDDASKHPRSDVSVHFMLADNADASAVQQTVSHSSRLRSTDSVNTLLNSVADDARCDDTLVDVILEAERSLFSFLGVPYNTPCSNIYGSSKDLSESDTTCNNLPDIVPELQTFVNRYTKATEMSNCKSSKCGNSHAFCTCPFKNYYDLKLPHNASLGDRIPDFSIKGTARGECLERSERTWNELKVLAEMLYAEQRLLMQPDCTCQHVQVAYFVVVLMMLLAPLLAASSGTFGIGD